ncbi:MAG: ribonuclease HI [Akkermansiaceae bacterium]|jgi:ribonuclease HI|tara:strand:- start:714 stop:1205 length:492 start_codon:yes stop_codon:yes gene_type:complete
MKKVVIYTDGGARGNPGPGGYGAVVTFGRHRKELKGAFDHTTNNRMELMAAIAALEMLKEPCDVNLHSDSKYLVDAMTKGWLEGWKKRGWLKSDRKPVLNQDLWRRLEAATSGHEITWNWVKGHAGNELNERCDELVHEAIDAGKLIVDQGYLDQQAGEPGLF